MLFATNNNMAINTNNNTAMNNISLSLNQTNFSTGINMNNQNNQNNMNAFSTGVNMNNMNNQINFTSPLENMLKLSSGNDSYQGTSKSKGQQDKPEKTIREEIEMQFSTANRGIHCSIKK